MVVRLGWRQEMRHVRLGPRLKQCPEPVVQGRVGHGAPALLAQVLIPARDDEHLDELSWGIGVLKDEPAAGRLGSITPGKLADLAGYPADPLAADPDDLAELTPAFTIVGGRATHDPDKRLAP